VLKVNEVYVTTTRRSKSSSPQACSKKIYSTRECLVNEKYIVAAYPHHFNSSSDEEMLQDMGADPKKEYTRLVLDGNNFRSSEMILEMPYSKFTGLIV